MDNDNKSIGCATGGSIAVITDPKQVLTGLHGARSIGQGRGLVEENGEVHWSDAEYKMKSPEPAGGLKYDSNKPMMELLPAYALEQIAGVLTFGARKYAPYNWQKGIEYSRLIGAALRHLFAFARGEDRDPESGLSHLAHAGCCVLFLIWMSDKRRDLDDRSKDVSNANV